MNTYGFFGLKLKVSYTYTLVRVQYKYTSVHLLSSN